MTSAFRNPFRRPAERQPQADSEEHGPGPCRQTVRYHWMTRLRERYGDRPRDPEWVSPLLLALSAPDSTD
jgi:hypothetical protein